FGRSDESNVYVTGGSKMRKRGKMKTTGTSMTAGAHDVTQTTSRETSSTRSRLLLKLKFKQTEINTRVSHGHSYGRARPEDTTLSRTYHGAQVTFRISDTKTTAADFAERTNRINILMGRPEVVPPDLKGLHASDITLAATVTPAHIEALAALDPNAPAT